MSCSMRALSKSSPDSGDDMVKVSVCFVYMRIMRTLRGRTISPLLILEVLQHYFRISARP